MAGMKSRNKTHTLQQVFTAHPRGRRRQRSAHFRTNRRANALGHLHWKRKLETSRAAGQLEWSLLLQCRVVAVDRARRFEPRLSGERCSRCCSWPLWQAESERAARWALMLDTSRACTRGVCVGRPLSGGHFSGAKVSLCVCKAAAAAARDRGGICDCSTLFSSVLKAGRVARVAAGFSAGCCWCCCCSARS